MKRLLESVCELINSECSAIGMYQTRCLASSVILSEVLKGKGFTSTLLTCEFDGYSKKILDLARSGEIYNMTGEQMVAASALQVTVFANRPDLGATDFNGNDVGEALYGHAALLTKHEKTGRCWLIDPTSFQFHRIQAVNGWVFDIPKHLVLEIRKSDFDYIEHLNSRPADEVKSIPKFIMPIACGGEVSYKYRRLDSLESDDMKVGSDKWLSSDANPLKYSSVISRVSDKVSLCCF